MATPKSALEELLAAASHGSSRSQRAVAEHALAALARDMAQELIDRRSAGQALADALEELAGCSDDSEVECGGCKALATWHALGEAEEGRDG